MHNFQKYVRPRIELEKKRTAPPSWRSGPTKDLCTVVIPHHSTPDLLELSVKLWQKAQPKVQIMIIDTGSVDDIEHLRDENCEIHYIRSHGWLHASEPVAAAMDLASLLCKTKWMMCTHADCFLRKRDAVSEFIEIAETQNAACVGYQISPRDGWGEVWKDWVGHTFTLLDRDVLDLHNMSWSLRRGVIQNYDLSLEERAYPDKPVLVKNNIIDTEVFINMQLQKAKQKVIIIGGEENYCRNVNEHFDHIRSYPSGQIHLSKKNGLRKKQEAWAELAMDAAKRRLTEWL